MGCWNSCKRYLMQNKCIKKLQKVSKEYKKGTLSEEEKDVLAKNKDQALERAKKLVEFQNPSTTIHRLLDLLKESS